jgi:hypothetical protein
LTDEIPQIESLRKLSLLALRLNFPVDNVHFEGDSVKFASPKSGFPYANEDIRIFSWNVAFLRPGNHKEILKVRAKSLF